jgi:hypothetical protein
MPKLKDGDLVRVTRQPANSLVDLKGEVGYVETLETHQGYIHFHLLDVDGNRKGMGTVPTDCIEVCDDPEWIVALLKNQEIQKNHEDTVIKWNSDLLDAQIVVAEKLGMPVNMIIEVLQMWDKEKPHNPYDR